MSENRVSTPGTSIRFLVGLVGFLAAVLEILAWLPRTRNFLVATLGLSTTTTLHGILRVAIPCCVGLALVPAMTFLYRRAIQLIVPSARWILILILAATSAAFVALSIVLIPPAPSLSDELARRRDSLLVQAFHHVAPSGGFFDPREANPEPNVWITCQVLSGVLSHPRYVTQYADEIRRCFSYVQAQRLPNPEGWRYMSNDTYGVTEVTAWVVVARSKALDTSLRSRIWSPEEQPLQQEYLFQDVEVLLQRQHRNGSCSPVSIERYANASRTYSTMMVVWALLEANQAIEMTDSLEAKVQSAIQRGVTWLLQSRRDTGWHINPNRPASSECAGLTSQVLYVLSLAEQHSYAMRPTEKWGPANRAYLKNDSEFTNLTINLCQVDDFDQYLKPTNLRLEGMHFLWLPWELAGLHRIAEDPETPEDIRKSARRRVLQVQDSIRHLWSVLNNRGLWSVGESLYALTEAGIMPIASEQ